MNIHDSPAPEQGTIVLVSGGIDSAVTLALAKQNSGLVSTMFFNYGQPHIKEMESSRKLCTHYKVLTHIRHVEVEQNIETNTRHELLLPNTWVPGRNLLFLVHAAMVANAVNSHIIAIGAHQEDYPGYPDCSFAALQGAEQALQESFARPISIWAPLLNMNKAQIVKLGFELNVPFEMTWSCYKGGDEPCHKCDACIRRERAFVDNASEDPAL